MMCFVVSGLSGSIDPLRTMFLSFFFSFASRSLKQDVHFLKQSSQSKRCLGTCLGVKLTLALGKVCFGSLFLKMRINWG